VNELKKSKYWKL